MFPWRSVGLSSSKSAGTCTSICKLGSKLLFFRLPGKLIPSFSPCFVCGLLGSTSFSSTHWSGLLTSTRYPASTLQPICKAIPLVPIKVLKCAPCSPHPSRTTTEVKVPTDGKDRDVFFYLACNCQSLKCAYVIQDCMGSLFSKNSYANHWLLFGTTA